MSKNSKEYIATVTVLPKRLAEVVGEISTEKMAEMRALALKKFVASAELPGFRKGAAPENLVAQKIGEMKLLEEAAEMALSHVWPEIIEAEKLEPIGQPNISITKIGLGSPLAFKMTVALRPEVKLADYKKITAAVKKAVAEAVEEKEIDEVILNMRREIAHAKFHTDHPEAGHDHGEMKDEDLPAIDDDFLKLVGVGTTEALREKIREGLLHEKEIKAKDKHRTDILEKIITDSTVTLPDLIVDSELEKMLAQFKDDVARANVAYEEYLKHIKKTEGDLKNEWRDTAAKRATGQIILSNIAQEENIVPTEEDIKREMEKILQTDKNLDRFRVRMFVENFLTNELVLKFLEQQV